MLYAGCLEVMFSVQSILFVSLYFFLSTYPRNINYNSTYRVIEPDLRPESERASLAIEVLVDPAAVEIVPAEHPVLVPEPVPLVEWELGDSGDSAQMLVDLIVNPQLYHLGIRVVPVPAVSTLLD